MMLRHLALPVRDQKRSRAFYERYLGFGARPAREYPDGVLMLFDAAGFALALGPAEEPPEPPGFLHLGFLAASGEEVRMKRETLELDGVEIAERWDEPGYVSLKVKDPDGYVVEIFWEEGV
jgi:catechol 2,3-dioxygenase-like lactoylglutathione lyase family enzyme